MSVQPKRCVLGDALAHPLFSNSKAGDALARLSSRALLVMRKSDLMRALLVGVLLFSATPARAAGFALRLGSGSGSGDAPAVQGFLAEVERQLPPRVVWAFTGAVAALLAGIILSVGALLEQQRRLRTRDLAAAQLVPFLNRAVRYAGISG